MVLNWQTIKCCIGQCKYDDNEQIPCRYHNDDQENKYNSDPKLI